MSADIDLDWKELIRANILAELKAMTEVDRLEIISQFCHDCGSNDPNCQCCNDE